MATPNWITTDEAVELSGYHLVHLRRLLRDGQVKAEKKGGSWWIDRDALLLFIDECKKSSDSRRGSAMLKKRSK